MILSTLKYQADGINVTEILVKRSWHTHMKHSKPYIFVLQKVKKPPDRFFNCLFFSSEIILISSGLFSHRLSRILIVKLNRIGVSSTAFLRNKSEPGGRIQIQVSPVGNQERSLPKSTSKMDHFVSAQFKRFGFIK